MVDASDKPDPRDPSATVHGDGDGDPNDGDRNDGDRNDGDRNDGDRNDGDDTRAMLLDDLTLDGLNGPNSLVEGVESLSGDWTVSADGSGRMDRPMPPEAPTLLGHYSILAELGAGGMGVVYVAHDRRLDRKVAIKQLLAKGSTEQRDRLLLEARAMAKLAHPNVVPVYEIGQAEGSTFIVMEYVEGETLRAWLDAEEPKDVEEILEILIQAGRGLEAAHAAGLIHRDFKPENVIVGDDGRVRVLDFGLVHSASEARTGDPVTRPELIVGTPKYMAFEQWSGQVCTPATDQFAFCVVAHEALFGVRPFLAEHFWQLPQKIEGAEFAAVELASPAHDRVYRVLRRGLATAAEHRWPSLSALLGALEQPHGLIDFSIERARHEHFFGRAELLADIDAQLDSWDRGWLLLTGGPGAGKSAISNHWLRRREAAGQPTAFHFIRRNHKNWAEPEVIRANLAAQIEAMFPAQREADPDAEDRLERLLTAVSPILAAEGQKLILVVDGLDEAMELGRSNPIPMMFPLELPHGVFVLAVSRPRFPHLNWFQRRGAPLRHFDLEALAASNEATVRAYWEARVLDMDTPPSPELVEAAIAGAHGNLQHAVKLHELWARKSTRSRADIPEGFEGMIEGLLERLGDLPKPARRLAWEGLVMLSAARESLPLEVLEELLDWDEGDGADEFLPLAREMLLEETGPSGPSYRLFHERFRERVEAARARMLRTHHARLAEYAAWPLTGDTFRRAYAVDHRVTHSIAADALDQAAQTCMDVGFLVAKANRRGVFEVELELRAAASALAERPLGKTLTTLARVVGACAHWARSDASALPAMVHDRLLTSAPALVEALRWPPELAAGARLLHPLQRHTVARVLRGQHGWVVALAVLPGDCVASASGERIRIWDLESGRQIAQLSGHRRPITALAVLPDGRLLSGASADALYLWSNTPDRQRQTLCEYSGTFTILAALPGDRVIGGDSTLHVWDLHTAKVLATLPGHEASVTNLVVLDARRVVVSDDDTLVVWDVVEGQRLAELREADATLTALLGLGGELILSGDEDGELRVWDLQSGSSRPFAPDHQQHGAHVNALVRDPQGRIVSSSFDKTVAVWALEPDGTGRRLASLQNHHTAVVALASVPDGRFVTGCADNSVRVEELELSTGDAGTRGHDDRVQALAVLPDGEHVVSGSRDHSIGVWSLATGRLVRHFEAHPQRVGALAVLPDGRLVSGSDDKTLRLWSLDAGPDALGDDPSSDPLAPVATLVGHQHHITTLASLPDGRLASGSQDNSVRIWDLGQGQELAVLEGHTSLVTAVVGLPDGRLVSAGQDRSLRVWDGRSGQALKVLPELPDYLNALAVLPDGRLVSGGQDRVVRIWNADLSAPVESFEGHQGPITTIAVLPDGRIASGARDQTVRVWQSGHEDPVAIVRSDAPFFSLAAPDAARLVAGDALGNLWFIGLGLG